MINSEYIKEKQKEKFDLFWSKKVKKFHKTGSQCSVEYKGTNYYFNKLHKTNENEYYIVCRKGVINGKTGKVEVLDRKVYSKNGFKEVFVDYDEYKRDLISLLTNFDRDYDGVELRQKNCTSKPYLLQQEYFLAFFRYIGCDIAQERKMLEYSFEDIKQYVISKKKTQHLTSRYFEFACYKAKELRYLLKHKISSILLNPMENVFIDYCKTNGFRDLHDLILIPYYTVALLEKFGQKLIEQIINDIKSFIDMQFLYATCVTSDDI